MPESVWEERRENNSVGFFQITGEKDDTVPKNSDGSARYSRAPAIEDVMDYWADSNGLELSETGLIGNASVLTKYWSAERQSQVWHLVVSDGHHSWPNEQYNQVNTNALILELAMIAYNILRMIGQESLKHKQPDKRRVHRRRLRTVISNLVLCASHVTRHARQTVMALGRSNTWRQAFWGIWNQFVLE